MRNLLASVILACLVLVLSTNAHVRAQDSLFPDPQELRGKKAGEIVLKSGKYDSNKVDYGYILVSENRDNPEARLIPLPFIRYHALQDHSSEPIFLMTGGPGKSNLWVDLPAIFFTRNDLVKVGYRGVDGEVKLKCPEIGKALAMENPLAHESLQKIRKIFRSNYDQLLQEGIDLDGYNMLEVVDDLETVRKALGYERINLFSTSYGTQLAYIYCLRYPRRIHRNLMFGASNRARFSNHLGWEPEVIEKMLGEYNALWKTDPEAVTRTPDILQIIKNVFKTLPRQWKHIRIDPDKLRIATFYLLYETETAAAVFDAYVAAENGDYSGLALIVMGYDEDIQSTSKHYWGDYLTKAVSGGLDTTRNYETEMVPPGSVLGSPRDKLFWTAASRGGWPVKHIPAKYRKLDRTDVETLIVNGSLDFSSPPDHIMETRPFFKNGKIVIVPGMGHMEVIKSPRQGFEHLVSRFYFEGVADTSKYSAQKIDFTPAETYQDYAKQIFKDK